MHRAARPTTSFRKDINGLRAWAVMAVLLFHFSLFGLSGGFVGVDVFFVISGYLMTLIIVDESENGSFSIWKFYMARARRILPALFALLVTLLALGWFWLPPLDYKSLGLQSFFAINSASNILFYKSAGYFDTAAEEKWLLHTWSLAVEAQFYLLFPIFVTVIRKFWQSIRAITFSLFILFLASFLLNLSISETNSSAAFYLLPTRIWELSAGGLIYLLTKQNVAQSFKSRSLHWLGWILIISSFIFINKQLSWPSYWAAVPVLGACFIIFSQTELCIFTNNRIAQWLGERSYSLYLWHWPIVVALYFTNLQNEWGWVTAGLLLSLILGHFSYLWLEKPSRKFLSQCGVKKELLTIAFSCLLLCIFSTSVKFSDYSWRLSAPEIQKVVSIQNQAREKPKNNTAMEGDIVLLGDSHAGVSAAYLKQAVERHSLSFSLFKRPGCPMLKGVQYTDFGMESANEKSCASYVEQVLNKKVFNTVVIMNRLPYYFYGPNELAKERFWNRPVLFLAGDTPEYNFSDNYRNKLKSNYIQTVCKIKAKSKKVFITRPIPEMAIHTSNLLIRNVLFHKERQDIRQSVLDYKKRNQFIWEMQDEAKAQCGVEILDPTQYLCDDNFCYASKDGYPYYSDNNHLNFLGNKLITPIFEQIATSFQ